MPSPIILERLNELIDAAHPIKLIDKDKIVIFSDLHMGNGRKQDDFLKNGSLFLNVLSNHYYKNNYTLILNGDIEELQKFSLGRILKQWKDVYNLFGDFLNDGRFHRIVGNHDFPLHIHKQADLKGDLLHALRLEFKKSTLLVFHGHQASTYYEKYNDFNGYLLRYIVNPLRIKNRSAAYDSQKRYRIEKKVYRYASRNKIVSIIGHTHRPLFESLSRVDYLKYEIEQLCRLYTASGKKEKNRIEKDIEYYKKELKHIIDNNRKMDLHSAVYNATIVIPCVFNSGCCIGKRGITGIEIADGKIRLVHWFDKKRSKKYFAHYDHGPQRLDRSDYYRMVLKDEFLDYIFTRIKLLA